MTAGELMRAARTRAGLSQQEVADRVGSPRSQVARWEADGVDPGFGTVRRVLKACGFDLSMALQPYQPDQELDERMRAFLRLTPKERLDHALTRGAAERSDYRFDPYALLEELQERAIQFILIGSLARLLQGADEVPEALELVVPAKRIAETDESLQGFATRSPGETFRSGGAWAYRSPNGALLVREEPAGTSGFADLRRRAERVHLGRGLQPSIAAVGDLVRMLEAGDDFSADQRLEQMRRFIELQQ